LSSAPCEARTALLLNWYAANARALPWRDTREPYRIWISEIMLQQTQVKTVLPRYQAWFERFPDISSLAAAGLDDVLKAWEGLGYYRRARFIHQAAQLMHQRFDGCFPTDFDDMLALPGIGRSTAGAIGSFCFAMHTPVLDGNVNRVLRRWHGEPEATDKRLWMLAGQAIEAADEPDTWNQAMMELGATLCSPKTPDCAACPVSADCNSAFAAHAPAQGKKPIAVRDVHWQVHLHACPERGIWLTQRPGHGIWAGLWSPPITELASAPDTAPSHVHLLTHRRLHLYAEQSNLPPQGEGQWVNDISVLAMPTGIHQLLAKQKEKA